MADERRPLDLLRAIRDAQGLGAHDVLVLTMLALRTNNATGTCHPSFAKIAEDTRLSLRQAKAVVASLAKKGLLDVVPRFEEGSRERTSNSYRVRVPVVHAAHHEVRPVHDVVQDTHDGGAPKARQVVHDAHEGGAPRAPKLPSELPHGTANGRETAPPPFALVSPTEALTAATSRDSKPVKGTASEIPGYSELIAHYFETFEAARGARPTFTSRMGKAAKTLIALMPVDEAKSVVTNWFGDPWLAKTKPELWDIAAEPNKCRGAVRGRKVSPQPPTDGPLAFVVGEGRPS